MPVGPGGMGPCEVGGTNPFTLSPIGGGPGGPLLNLCGGTWPLGGPMFMKLFGGTLGNCCPGAGGGGMLGIFGGPVQTTACCS